MGLFDKLLKPKPEERHVVNPESEAVFIHIETDDLDSSFLIEEELMELLEGSGLGEVDGNCIGQGQLVIYLYGPDAEALFKFIEPTLRADEFCEGARVKIRWGGLDAPHREVVL